MVHEEVGPTEQAKEEGHDHRPPSLLASVDMEEAETELGDKSGVDVVVRRAKVKDELPKPQVLLGNTGKTSKGVDKDSGGGLDLAIEEEVEVD